MGIYLGVLYFYGGARCGVIAWTLADVCVGLIRYCSSLGLRVSVRYSRLIITYAARGLCEKPPFAEPTHVRSWVLRSQERRRNLCRWSEWGCGCVGIGRCLSTYRPQNTSQQRSVRAVTLGAISRILILIYTSIENARHMLGLECRYCCWCAGNLHASKSVSAIRGRWHSICCVGCWLVRSSVMASTSCTGCGGSRE